MEQSTSIKELASALSSFEAEMDSPERNKVNPHYKSAYVSLDGAVQAAKELLGKHGLSVSQLFDVDILESGQQVDYLVTILMHKSGEWLRGKMRLHFIKDDPQGVGSSITYMRRYSLLAILGMAPDDDDGEKAMEHFPREDAKSTPAETCQRCQKKMMISKLNQNEWYCYSCKATKPRVAS